MRDAAVGAADQPHGPRAKTWPMLTSVTPRSRAARASGIALDDQVGGTGLELVRGLDARPAGDERDGDLRLVVEALVVGDEVAGEPPRGAAR